jgi:protein gp37
MGSKIEWTTKTWNPTTGCTHYSSASNGGNECLNCYAETETRRLKLMGNAKYKQGFDIIVEHEDVLNEPYTWKKPTTVFVNSMSDLLHLKISDDFIRKVFKVMNDNPQHTFQILTKRHTRIGQLPNNLIWSENIWLGVSCGTQYATKRIPALVTSLAKHKFLSIEPFIQEISDIDLNGIDWVIAGGESGNTKYKIDKDDKGQEKYEIVNNKVVFTYLLDANGNKIIDKEIRPMKKEWVDIIRNKCLEKDVPFFFKQWGKTKNNPNQQDPTINTKHRYHSKGGCELDGNVYRSNPTLSNNSAPTINLFDNEYLIMDEIEDLVTIWELKTHLPLLEKDLFENLKEDIKKNGLNAPIIYIQVPNGKKLVVEGHTRLTALLELKHKEILTKELNETFDSLDEIKLWIVKHQLARRNLTTEERVRLAFLSKPTIEKLAKENLSKAGKTTSKEIDEELNSAKIKKVDTFAEIAKIANVGRTTVVNYSKIMNEANKSTKEQLSKGLITIGAAHASLKNKIELVSPKLEKKPNPQKEKLDKPGDIIILENIDDGKQKISHGEIDVVMIFDKNDKLNILKKNSNFRIGVFYL